MALSSHIRGFFTQNNKLKNIIDHAPHFTVELTILVIMVVVVAGNLAFKANATSAQFSNRSLFFVYIKNNPKINEKLVDAMSTVNFTINNHGGVLSREVLAAPMTSKDLVMREQTADQGPLPTLSGSTLIKPNPASNDNPSYKRDTEVYVVRGGDTVARIASAYGVSTDTIIWENNLNNNGMIKPGQELSILPTSGVKHTIQKGETLGAIANKYNIELEIVLEYNSIEIPEFIMPGEQIIIPNGVKSAPPTPERQQYIASLQVTKVEQVNVPASYEGSSSGLIWPIPGATRISQSYWSRHLAIDVPCKSCEVIASADGIVELSGWQGGYGNTIVINHGNGLKTRYAHAQKLSVSAGQRVKQGETIMISGSTGRSTGPHLHFEVIRNGSFLNPLQAVTR